MATTTEQVLARLRLLGTASRRDLAAAMGVSAPTVYRRLQTAEADGRAVRYGGGRATRWAVRAPLFQRVSGELPLFGVDGHGRIHHLANLLGLAAGATLVKPPDAGTTVSRLLLGEAGTGHFDDLPFFLQDLRPQGFLGRQFAHATVGFPDHPDRWSSAQVGAYLLDYGVDLPGDLLVGEDAVARYRHWQPQQATPEAFPELADRVLAGGFPGSSAGGEQPKFPAQVAGRAVLVKFSPAETRSAAARRWRDLLVAEHLALTVLAEHDLPVAPSRIVEAGGRLFLESERFDRTAAGRLPAVSLAALDAEYVGAGRGWTEAADGLRRARLMEGGDLGTIATAQAFGDWIENTDQHLGNITLQPHPDGWLRIAPFYDMVPMRHAPRQGELPPVPPFHPPIPAGAPERWRQTGAMASRFWQLVADDSRISRDFQRVAKARQQAIEEALQHEPTAPGDSARPGPGW